MPTGGPIEHITLDGGVVLRMVIGKSWATSVMKTMKIWIGNWLGYVAKWSRSNCNLTNAIHKEQMLELALTRLVTRTRYRALGKSAKP